MLLPRVYRTLQLVSTIYICASIIYATCGLLGIRIKPPLLKIGSLYGRPSSGHSEGIQFYHFPGYWSSRAPNRTVSLASKHIVTYGGDQTTTNRLEVSEGLFLSKAFAQSMHPSKIIPYFYRATASLEQDDITIATLVTSNRFEVFKKLVVSYKGPVSVAIHIKDSTEEIEALLDRLHELYTSDPLMSLYVDVHLVVDRFDRQFNTWRNIARLFARTDFVMMLDVDFAVCTDFRSSIRRSRAIMDKLEAGNTALVVPAFEYVKQRDGMDQSKFPKSKKELVSLVRQGLVDIFHRSWAPGHNSTDYDRFYVAQPGEVYKVTQYQSAYEPYVIFKKEGPPWYQ